MKKKKIAAVVAIMAALIILGVIIPPAYSRAVLRSTGSLALAYRDVGRVSGQSEYCSKINGAYFQYSKQFDKDYAASGELFETYCNIEIARQKQDSQFCTSIANERERLDCYYQVAVSSKKVELCPKDNARCIEQTAIEIPDPNLCDLIANSSDPHLNKTQLTTRCRRVTEGLVQKNYTICNLITNEYPNCLAKLAIQSQNPELCKKAANAGKQDNCFYEMARETKNWALCQELNTQYLKKDCELDKSIYDLTTGNAPDSAQCASFSEPEKSECYLYAAIILKESSLCDKINYKPPASTGPDLFGDITGLVANTLFELNEIKSLCKQGAAQ